MASFDLAIPILLRLEGDGAISQDPALSRFGITETSYPKVDIKGLSRLDAINIYRQDWWLPAYNQITYQDIITKLFCLAVNMGQNRANICLQYAIRATNGIILIPDGKLDADTLSALVHCHEDVLLAAFKSEAACAYRLKVERNPKLMKYLKGWLYRAYL